MDYKCHIQYLDIQESIVMTLVNEEACMSPNTFIQQNYKNDIFLQILLSSVNGITLKQQGKSTEGAIIDENNENEIIKRNDVPIANVFFKFCHMDVPCAMTGFQPSKITNHYQKIVVQELKSVIDNY